MWINQLFVRKKIHFLKWVKYLNSHFTKKGYQIASKFIKMCSTSLVIREREIQTTMRYTINCQGTQEWRN